MFQRNLQFLISLYIQREGEEEGDMGRCGNQATHAARVPRPAKVRQNQYNTVG